MKTNTPKQTEPQRTDQRIERLVNLVAKHPSTAEGLQRHLRSLGEMWTRPTLRRILRDCERMGVLRREKGAVRSGEPGRPSDVWWLA